MQTNNTFFLFLLAVTLLSLVNGLMMSYVLSLYEAGSIGEIFTGVLIGASFINARVITSWSLSSYGLAVTKEHNKHNINKFYFFVAGVTTFIGLMMSDVFFGEGFAGEVITIPVLVILFSMYMNVSRTKNFKLNIFSKDDGINRIRSEKLAEREQEYEGEFKFSKMK